MKYKIKDYVRYYQGRISGTNKLCDEKYGYIVGIEHRCNDNGDIESRYVLSNYIGSCSGCIVSENAIIEKAKPKDKYYGRADYLRDRVLGAKRRIKELEKQIKHDEQEIKELEEIE